MTSFEEWKKIPNNFVSIDQRNPKETRVVLGMTGGIDSAAAAFLLKNRGFQCTGVGIVLLDEEEMLKIVRKRRAEILDAEKFKVVRSKGKGRLGLTFEEDARFLNGNCSVKDLDRAKRVCDALEIPFYAVNAVSEFSDLILDPLVASKLSGEVFVPCVNCNNVKVEILMRKAHMLKTDFVATGHYAKVHKDEQAQNYHLFNSNDEEYDQSHLLSRLEQHQLARLILPLGELRRSEVIKIMEKFQLSGQVRRDSRKICFVSAGNLPLYVEGKSNEKFRPTGSVVIRKTGIHLGEHYGIHFFKTGDKGIEDKMLKVNLVSFDNTLIVLSGDPSGRVLMGQEEELMFSGCGIVNMNMAAQVDILRPINVFVKFALNDKKVMATITFKNNRTAVLEFNKKVYGLCKGQHVTFYNKELMGAKVVGSGTIAYLGDMSVINRTQSMDMVIKDDDGNPIVRQINPLRF